MAKLIDKGSLEVTIKEKAFDSDLMNPIFTYAEIMSLIDREDVVEERREGKWVLLDECANNGYYCSECHKKLVKEGWSNTVKKINFCPNCGVDMRGQ